MARTPNVSKKYLQAGLTICDHVVQQREPAWTNNSVSGQVDLPLTSSRARVFIAFDAVCLVYVRTCLILHGGSSYSIRF